MTSLKNKINLFFILSFVATTHFGCRTHENSHLNEDAKPGVLLTSDMRLQVSKSDWVWNFKVNTDLTFRTKEGTFEIIDPLLGECANASVRGLSLDKEKKAGAFAMIGFDTESEACQDWLKQAQLSGFSIKIDPVLIEGRDIILELAPEVKSIDGTIIREWSKPLSKLDKLNYPSKNPYVFHFFVSKDDVLLI